MPLAVIITIAVVVTLVVTAVLVWEFQCIPQNAANSKIQMPKKKQDRLLMKQ